MKLDPKKMAVVKQTITTAAPTGGKTKGGVPLDPTEALKFFDAEIKRHEELQSQARDNYYNEVDKSYSQVGKLNPDRSMGSNSDKYKAQMDQTYKQKTFLENQKKALINKIKNANAAKAAAKAKAIEDAKPVLQKAGEAVSDYGKEVGGRLKEIWERRDRPSGSPILKIR